VVVVVVVVVWCVCGVNVCGVCGGRGGGGSPVGCNAFVDINARKAIARVTRVARAREAALRVNAACVRVAQIGRSRDIASAFVDVAAKSSAVRGKA
jgi:hypothetical protein